MKIAYVWFTRSLQQRFNKSFHMQITQILIYDVNLVLNTALFPL